MELKKTIIGIFATFMLLAVVACGGGNANNPTDEPVTGERTAIPPVTATNLTEYNEWAYALAAIVAEHTDILIGGSHVVLKDIDGDSIPEVVEYAFGTGGTDVLRIFGYENGVANIWYDFTESYESLGDIFFVKDGDLLRCFSMRVGMRHQSTEFSIYELVKGVTHTGETAIVPVTMVHNVYAWNHDRLEATDEVINVIESLIETQKTLFELTQAIIGEPYEFARTLALHFPTDINNEDELASVFRDW